MIYRTFRMGRTSIVILRAQSHPLEQLKGPAEAGYVPARPMFVGKGEDVASNNSVIELL